MKKSPKKKLTKCQGFYNTTKGQCESNGCLYVQTKDKRTYCRSPMNRKQSTKSPIKKKSKCQGMKSPTMSDCTKKGCLYAKKKNRNFVL